MQNFFTLRHWTIAQFQQVADCFSIGKILYYKPMIKSFKITTRDTELIFKKDLLDIRFTSHYKVGASLVESAHGEHILLTAFPREYNSATYLVARDEQLLIENLGMGGVLLPTKKSARLYIAHKFDLYHFCVSPVKT